MKRTAIIEEGFAILPGGKAIVTGKGITKTTDGGTASAVLPKDTSSSEYSRWGDDNLFPQNVITDLEKNAVAWRALEKRKTVHFGRGIIAYRDVINAQGKPERQPVKDPEVLQFMRTNRINLQWSDLIGGLEIFANGWIEFITNLGGDKINKLFVKDPAYCRVAKMDEASLRIAYLYFSAQWANNPSISDEKLVKKIPFWNPLSYDGKSYPDTKFAYQVSYKSFGKSYYQMAAWNGVRVNKWMDIASKVPALKYAMMKNQMTIKYHVQVPDYYFDKKFPSPDYTPEQKNAEITKILNDLNDFLSDVDNSGKSFVSFTFYDKVNQRLQEGWKIDVIDNKLEDGNYLPDSQAANSEILFGIGIDPCLIGGSSVPGGKLGAGSGSDKREAYWMLNADMGPSRQVSLEPLYFVRDFNKWDQEIQFDYVTVDTSQTQAERPTKTTQRIDQNQE